MTESPQPTTSRSRATATREYRVPRRFSLSEGLAILTLFGILFNLLHFLNAPQGMFLFLGVLGMTICLVQMRFGAIPRAASIATGVSLLILWEIPTHNLFPTAMVLPISLLSVTFYLVAMVLGSLMGYALGTLAAGIFLASNHLTVLLRRKLRRRQRAAQGQMTHVGPWPDADHGDDSSFPGVRTSAENTIGADHDRKKNLDDRR